jgi:hypothetical protein
MHRAVTWLSHASSWNDVQLTLYSPIVTTCNACLNVLKLCILPTEGTNVCFEWFSQEPAFVSLNSVNCLIFVVGDVILWGRNSSFIYTYYLKESLFKGLNGTLQSIEFGMTFFDIYTSKRHCALEITALFISARLWLHVNSARPFLPWHLDLALPSRFSHVLFLRCAKHDIPYLWVLHQLGKSLRSRKAFVTVSEEQGSFSGACHRDVCVRMQILLHI